MAMAHPLIATPETDAALRTQYNAMGKAAYEAGKHDRCPPCDPDSMIAGWWYEGFDKACHEANRTKFRRPMLEG